ncbi:MAG: hypothetical protein CMK59_09415 [Proteobacteria bacterium]|nr:hypothetical protein [Pseudomonadota bacterium]
MKRKRRSPEEAKAEILSVAEQLILEDGPNALTLKKIAKTMKLSHPAILHHFGSAEQLMTALQQKMSRSIREDFIDVLSTAQNPTDRLRFIDQVLAKLSDPRNGRTLAFLLASGVDPFPNDEEKGLEHVLSNLNQNQQYNTQELQNTILLAVLCMYAEGMMGELIRKRLGHNLNSVQFRHWMLELLGKNLQLPASQAPKEPSNIKPTTP